MRSIPVDPARGLRGRSAGKEPAADADQPGQRGIPGVARRLVQRGRHRHVERRHEIVRERSAGVAASLLLGVAVTGIVGGVVRGSSAEWIARRLVRSNWTTLATIAESRGRQNRAALASVMLNRLALIGARLAVLPAELRKEAADLRTLRAGLGIIELRRARP